jgi:hypothetical protein
VQSIFAFPIPVTYRTDACASVAYRTDAVCARGRACDVLAKASRNHAVEGTYVVTPRSSTRVIQRKTEHATHSNDALVAAAISTVAIAQPANRDANTPAVNAPNSPPNPGAPVAGANSFTEGQAKSRIESSGYANVSELRKDDQVCGEAKP